MTGRPACVENPGARVYMYCFSVHALKRESRTVINGQTVRRRRRRRCHYIAAALAPSSPSLPVKKSSGPAACVCQGFKIAVFTEAAECVLYACNNIMCKLQKSFAGAVSCRTRRVKTKRKCFLVYRYAYTGCIGPA